MYGTELVVRGEECASQKEVLTFQREICIPLLW